MARKLGGWQTRVRIFGFLLSMECATTTGLVLYTAVAQRDVIVPVQLTARLDARARDLAIEYRKQILPVRAVPYATTSADSIKPIFNPATQRGMDVEFRDGDSGLFIRTKSHLCLPGIDRNISGGVIRVSNGDAEWQITFQLLGSANPSAFQSTIPRSRDLLNRLESMARDARPPGRDDYYSALQAALDAEGDEALQQKYVVRLLRLLLTSFFTSTDFANAKAFAESHRLIN